MNTTIQSIEQLKLNLLMLKIKHTLTLVKRLMIMILNLKLVIIQLNTVRWTYVIDDLNGEEITGTFYEKELRKIDQQE